MSKIKHLLDLILTKKFGFKFIAYALLIGSIYLFSDFIGLFLLTFIFSYLFYSFGKFLKNNLDFYLKKYCPKKHKIFKKVFSLNLIIIIEYIVFLGMFIFMIGDLVPKLTKELSELPKTLPFLSEYSTQVSSKLEEIKTFNSEIGGSFQQIFDSKDLDVVIEIFDKLKSASVVLMQILLSLILSFIFIIDRNKLGKYLLNIKKSSFSFLYKEYEIILEKIVKSFGLILKAQATIALANAILTTIGLIAIGGVHSQAFPYLLTLTLIVFIAGFIPILGVFISSIPIIIVGYSAFGGYTIVFEIILLIGIIHIIEAYYLNPKIVSKYLELPVSMTFIILIISENLFGIAGLLIGVSLFYFLVGLLVDIDKSVKKEKKLRKDNKLLEEKI